MFSPILGSRCLATILVVINGAAVPAPARTLAPPISPASLSVPSCRAWPGRANGFTRFFAKATSAKNNS